MYSGDCTSSRLDQALEQGGYQAAVHDGDGGGARLACEMRFESFMQISFGNLGSSRVTPNEVVSYEQMRCHKV